MPSNFNWHDDEHSIIRIDIFEVIAWEQYQMIVDKIVSEASTVTHRVDLIFNITVSFPKGNPMPHLKMTIDKLAKVPNMGLTYNVSSRYITSIVKAMIELSMLLHRIDTSHNGGFVTSLEEALELIAQDRAKNQQTMAHKQ